MIKPMSDNLRFYGRQFIKRYEGYNSSAYLDTVGVWTIGFGFTRGVKKGDFITVDVAVKRLDEELDIAYETALRFYPGMNDANIVRRAVMLDLGYNLGGRLSQFVNTNKYMNQQDWVQASINLSESLWANQVKRRAVEDIQALRYGIWSFDVQPWLEGMIL